MGGEMMEWSIEMISLAVAAFSAFASAIAAIFGVASYCLSKRNEKGSVLKKIEKKQQKIRHIEGQMNRKYGLNRSDRGLIKPEQLEINKLKSEIAELEDRI